MRMYYRREVFHDDLSPSEVLHVISEQTGMFTVCHIADLLVLRRSFYLHNFKASDTPPDWAVIPGLQI